jgi:transcriptional regulator with XRE-family HTH domain
MSTPEARIAARMREARENINGGGISQEEMGRRLGITLRTYARWERGESFGYLTRLGEIAKALETTEGNLLGGEDPLTAQPTVEDLSTKMDQILARLDEMHEDLRPRKRR